MSDPQKTVFISYRRSVSKYIARAIFMDLRHNGYNVFLDTVTIDNGPFDTAILNQIAARAHFAIILTAGTLERCDEPGDWLRREIEYAIDLQRNIVPILMDEFTFDEASQKHLTGKLSNLNRLNGLKLHYDYFDEGMDRLRNRYLKKPLYGIITPTPPAEEKKIEQQIKAAATEPQPTKEELTAEQLFNRANMKARSNNLDGALDDCNRALQLNPDYANAYNNRGTVRADKGDLDAAINDYNRALQLNPDYGDAYNNRGTAHADKGDLDAAINDYNRALQLNPDYANALLNRAEVYFELQQFEKALLDFEKADELRPDFFMIIGGLAITHHALGNSNKAKRLWKSLVEKNRRYLDATWVKIKLDWTEPLVEAARKLIASLDT